MKPILRIVRLPNVLTAASNSLAGAFCAGIALDRWQVLIGLAIVSMSIYASGILFNDLFDLEEDRRERPERPLPSGALRVRTVLVLAVTLMVIGTSIAWSLGTRAGLVGTLLVASVLGYDGGLKRTVVGPWVMGLCRGSNFALGLAVIDEFDVRLLIPVAGYVLYVAGITYVSRQETYVGRTTGIRSGFALIVAGLWAVLLTVILESGFRLDLARIGIASWSTILAIFLLFLLLKSLTNHFSNAMADPRPATVGGMVKAGVISIPLLDFSQTLAIAGVPKAAAIALIWLLARATAKRLYTT